MLSIDENFVLLDEICIEDLCISNGLCLKDCRDGFDVDFDKQKRNKRLVNTAIIGDVMTPVIFFRDVVGGRFITLVILNKV